MCRRRGRRDTCSLLKVLNEAPEHDEIGALQQFLRGAHEQRLGREQQVGLCKGVGPRDEFGRRGRIIVQEGADLLQNGIQRLVRQPLENVSKRTTPQEEDKTKETHNLLLVCQSMAHKQVRFGSSARPKKICRSRCAGNGRLHYRRC